MAQASRPDIRPAGCDDAAAIARIYGHYVETSTFTFEEIAPTPQQIAERLAGIVTRGLPWLVAEMNGSVLGYAYAAPWRERSAYRYAVEVSAYVAPDQLGCGTGSALYAQLLPELQALGLHTALAVVPLPNPASVALYEKLGFVQVAQLSEVGFKFGRWVDVAYWQLVLVNNRKI